LGKIHGRRQGWPAAGLPAVGLAGEQGGDAAGASVDFFTRYFFGFKLA
jgi:hypothetical protein